MDAFQLMFRAMFSPIIRSTWLFTVSGSIHRSCCRLVSWMRFNSCFGRCFRSSSGALDCIYSIWWYSPKLLPASVMDEFQLMFRAMFSPIIRSAWLYLQYLVVFTQVAAGWYHGWVSTHPWHQPAATWVNTTRYCKYSHVLLMTGENIARNM